MRNIVLAITASVLLIVTAVLVVSPVADIPLSTIASAATHFVVAVALFVSAPAISTSGLGRQTSVDLTNRDLVALMSSFRC